MERLVNVANKMNEKTERIQADINRAIDIVIGVILVVVIVVEVVSLVDRVEVVVAEDGGKVEDRAHDALVPRTVCHGDGTSGRLVISGVDVVQPRGP